MPPAATAPRPGGPNGDGTGRRLLGPVDAAGRPGRRAALCVEAAPAATAELDARTAASHGTRPLSRRVSPAAGAATRRPRFEPVADRLPEDVC
jgi:hypothetical protein